jgi:preprotein translocase SecE subunit
VARNRKRAKERRARRPQPVASARAEQLDDSGAAQWGEAGSRAAGKPEDAAPAPIAHAAPDVELAEAQLALGRPDLADGPEPELGSETEREPEDDDLDLEATGAGGGPGGADFDGEGGGDGLPPGGGGGLAVPGGAVPEPHIRPGNRLINFLQGSWRELQRVQWPDRRQVMQATGVVIGFVIVAGVFLGVADFLAGKLMNYILTGHFK